MPEPITEAAKSYVLAAVFWLVGTIIFLLAAYKVYQPKQGPPHRPVPPQEYDCCCMP